jgi:hypothetical protein
MANELVADRYALPLTKPLGRGRYSLELALDARGEFLHVADVMLVRDEVPEREQLSPTHVIEAEVGGRIRFLGLDAPTHVAPGETLSAHLYWQANRDLFHDLSGSLQLLDPAGRLVAQSDGITGQGLEPTSLWLPGRTVRERRELKLSPILPPGEYRMIAVMYRLPDARRLRVVTPAGPGADNAIDLGVVQVTPARRELFAGAVSFVPSAR